MVATKFSKVQGKLKTLYFPKPFAELMMPAVIKVTKFQ